ncbi:MULTISPECIES: ABC transporter permease [Brenneria]|uniref:ABC transporter permease subunit n=1 Tax=Brenneria nigrifluens DSM 30175 = ATCC 13028 TaxID=1121120 RepID=A0A2U1UQZ1_9GAMM|nr:MULTISPECIES: ABC transporter permease subunit [Brenneria]EHD22251.1 polar amino acid ABC transporter, inner membrane subunit [Brenneria sp. EniD312]PWC24080.1 amino acid ABC transporter permease [Brenneria nigrifluens DSM 30175 = ATCC 13028]QCR05273.1 ABC transporter permease subunit [Brenneria nigrifluens DSM 30175 = ATCC 13028]
MSGNYFFMVIGAGWVTLQLALAALLLAVLIGLLCALGKQSGARWLNYLIAPYTLLARGIPDLVLMLLVFYSLPALLNNGIELAGGEYRVEFSPFTAGFVTLGFIFGAYMTETFRNALTNIPYGEIEAAQAFGFSAGKTFYRIVLPQMIRLALPGFTNNWLVLMKATALVSLLGLEDIMFRTRSAAESTGQPFTFYLLAGAFYLAITLLSVLALRLLSKRYALGVREVDL